MDEAEELEQAETRQRLDALVADTATKLRLAGDDREAIAGVIFHFHERGLAILYHPAILWGIFEKALEKAGFDSAAQDRRFRIYSTVSHERFSPAEPFPADWPWLEDEKGAEPPTSAR